MSCYLTPTDANCGIGSLFPCHRWREPVNAGKYFRLTQNLKKSKVKPRDLGVSGTFLWLLSTEGVTKAFSHRSHLYFLRPSCTTCMWTFSVSLRLNVASHWSHLNVLSPGRKEQTRRERQQFPRLNAEKGAGLLLSCS